MPEELKSLLGLDRSVQDLKSCLSGISELVESGLDRNKSKQPALHYESIYQVLGMNVDNHHQLSTKMSELADRSNRLARNVEQVVADENSKWIQEQEKIDTSARQARRHAWLMWRDRSARWVLGALCAVLLYSGFVELADAVSWLHIPVRDLIISK